MDSLFQTLPIFAVIGMVLVIIASTLRPVHSWLLPAFVCALFSGWTLFAIATEGPVGFWAVHIVNAWGNQVWFDLLIAIAIGWCLILPRARAANMRLWPWLALILCTGCIGLSAMLARCFYLESRRPA